MNGRSIIGCALLATLLCACGGEEGFAQVSTELLVPQTLAEDLSSIEVYLFQTELGAPRAEELLSNTELYKSFDYQKKEIFPYPGTSQAVMEGIPDRGNVWRFYARGKNSNGVLIGHGATAGLYDINPDSDAPLQVSLTITPTTN